MLKLFRFDSSQMHEWILDVLLITKVELNHEYIHGPEIVFIMGGALETKLNSLSKMSNKQEI